MSKVIAQRVTFTVEVSEEVRERTFMDTRDYPERQWREELAVAVLGDFGGWYRINLVDVQPVYDDED